MPPQGSERSEGHRQRRKTATSRRPCQRVLALGSPSPLRLRNRHTVRHCEAVAQGLERALRRARALRQRGAHVAGVPRGRANAVCCAEPGTTVRPHAVPQLRLGHHRRPVTFSASVSRCPRIMSSRKSSISSIGGGSAASGSGSMERSIGRSRASSRAPSNAASDALLSRSSGRPRYAESFGTDTEAAYQRSLNAPGSRSPYVRSTAGSATPSQYSNPLARDEDLYPVPSWASRSPNPLARNEDSYASPSQASGGSGKASSSGGKSVNWLPDKASWGSRVASVVSGQKTPSLVSYSPTIVPSKAEEPREAEDYAMLTRVNSYHASMSGSVLDFGRDEYLSIAAESPAHERDLDSERAMSNPNSGPWARTEYSGPVRSIAERQAVLAARAAEEESSQASKKSSWKSWRS